MASELTPSWLGAGFCASVERVPDRPAIEVGGESVSYRDLYDKAVAVADLLTRVRPSTRAVAISPP